MTTTTEATIARQLIDGEFTPGSGATEEVFDPATGRVLAVVRHSTEAEVDAAVRAAAAAFPSWAETPVPDRAEVMFRYKALLEAHAEELAELVTAENGKMLAEARGEVRRGIEVVAVACGAPTLLLGTALDQIAKGIDEELVRFPVGVVAGICPFNFPMMVPLWMLPLALVAGNTFVLKPSPRTPLSAVRELELLVEAGLPRGVVNLVHGDRAPVEALLAHPLVDAVSFVGSAGVARNVYAAAAGAGKRVQALGGAKNHLIVMDDADLDQTVPAVLGSAFGNAGQRCLAGSVVVAVGAAGDRLVDALATSAAALRLGPGTDPSAQLGPVIRAPRVTELSDAIAEGEKAGAALLVDGRERTRDEGFFLGASLFDHVTEEMSLWRDELFGPVLSVVRADSLDDALGHLNASRYGNAASIFTRSGGAARTFKRRAEAGMLGINVGVAAPMSFFPFCGWKASFFGDLHATGADGVRFYTRSKVVTSRWFDTGALDEDAPEGRGH
ncbi:MAG TPA: CoA-acylating methylmalonate-semialdehyde dehydrogenase [Acidimicrobiales bacterium]|jgi:malonate-semialdehyde dehydrogenase (acetylating)/methylmalonate-semialdehyde dehydrogenase|nr:CoA-acylating methylmalonate-semialdehyde dehydrogenase [Acidimicrobiales bacterium]